MYGSTFGNIYKISTWGESHGKSIGVVIDGCPSGLNLYKKDIQLYLNKRKPGQTLYTTQRKEDDCVKILSGIFNNKTTGTPIALIVNNINQHSYDYNKISYYYRPGHADKNYNIKYKIYDYRGGGRSSGRETIGRVAAGAIAIKLLNKLGINILTYTYSIGPIAINRNNFDKKEINKNIFYMPDIKAVKQVQNYLKYCINEKNSSGGIVECIINGISKCVGNPIFEKLDANLAKAVFSIGAVKSFEIGDGTSVSSSNGLYNNDYYYTNKNVNINKMTNHSGGIIGGISDNDIILIRTIFKPTPSISSIQKTIDIKNNDTKITIFGRHDPIIIPRAIVVVESMVAIVLLNAILSNVTTQLDIIKTIFDN